MLIAIFTLKSILKKSHCLLKCTECKIDFVNLKGSSAIFLTQQCTKKEC
jgi:hypothetical protein